MSDWHQRFWSHVQKAASDQCWNWDALEKRGYGYMNNVDGHWRRAHRLSWELHHGPIPQGKCVLHACDNRACVNPRHLWIGTRADNARDRDNKNRCPYRQQHPMAKLTLLDVGAIRSLHGQYTQRTIASRFGVSQSQISHIMTQRCWR